MPDWNSKIIEEFHANEGRVGGPFEGHPLLLLHNRGARTGAEHVKPLAYQDLGDGKVAVFASKGGSPKHPAWYFNVKANPDVSVEIGTKTYPARARVAQGEERDRIWTRQKQLMPGFADYERKTSRQIPVIVLDLGEPTERTSAA
jgi:deazaflavin-dependent oxidoreductase (nitroreductase family)